jgi:hypothetical protein
MDAVIQPVTRRLDVVVIRVWTVAECRDGVCVSGTLIG